MAKAKKSKKKQKKSNLDVAVVVMIVISILLAVLIYAESGYIGKHLSPMLGGLFGFIKYIIPVGTFAIGIYLAYDDKEYFMSKLIQYLIVILCVSAVMSIYQISIGNITEESELGDILKQAYSLRRKKYRWGCCWNPCSNSFYKNAWNAWNGYFGFRCYCYIDCIYIWI